MKFEIEVERTFPHPIEKVWAALVDRAALGAWLMETDFVAGEGREFRIWCEDGAGGTDNYLCRVLEIDPPHRMRWSWVLDGKQADGETHVEFRLRAVDGGTRLTVIHSGDRDETAVAAFEGGWPVKLEQLGETLSAAPASR